MAASTAIMGSQTVRTQFVIVGAQRTGSGAIVNGLSLHPRIVCGWEWTQRVAPWRSIDIAAGALRGELARLPLKHRQHLATCDLAGADCLGFKRLFRCSHLWVGHPAAAPALLVDRLEPHLKWLARNPQIRVIHLVRRDNLDWLKSKALARASGDYTGATYRDDLSVALPVAESLKRVRSKMWVDSRLGTLAATNPYLRVGYEEFLGDNAGWIAAAVRFLGADPLRLPPVDVSLRARRQSSRGARAHIENFAALEAALEHEGLRYAG
jgi:hypothetical protein